MKPRKVITEITIEAFLCYGIVVFDSAPMWRIGMFLNVLAFLFYGIGFVVSFDDAKSEDLERIKPNRWWLLWAFARFGATLVFIGFGHWGYGIVQFLAWVAAFMVRVCVEAEKLKPKTEGEERPHQPNT